MNNKEKIDFILVLLLITALLTARFASAEAGALQYMQSISDTQQHELHSTNTGYDYHIFVQPPAGYSYEGTEKYATVYLLDGGITYPMLASYYYYLRAQEAVPDLIIVGISYGTDDWTDGNHRGTDYTAPSSERENWGGAMSFQKMLRQELVPLIEEQYRVESDRRIIFGQSLGGQFVLFSALTDPGFFSGYIASNPALHRNLEFFTDIEPSSVSSPSRLYVASAAGDEPQYRVPALAWFEYWKLRKEPAWSLKTETVEGYGHFSLAPESFRRGLAWAFTTP